MNSYNGFSPAQRNAALRWANGERAAGRRTRPTRCMTCGQTRGAIVNHSEDYSSPYGPHIGAFELCYRCHMMIHSRFRAPIAFDRYVGQLEAGARWPGSARNWYVIQAMLAALETGQLDLFGLEPRTDGDPGLLRRIAAGEFDPRTTEPARRSGE